MAINSVTSKVSKLFTKSTGLLVEGGSKVAGEKGVSVSVPRNALSYDFFSGTGKKGDFQSFLFKNKNGKAIQHYTRYFAEDGSVKNVVTDFQRENGILNILRKTIGVCKSKTEFVSFLRQYNPFNAEEIIWNKSFIVNSPSGDRGGIELLRKGQKASGVSFRLNWDGKPAKIRYKNTEGKKLDITEEETRYLPFIPRKYVIFEQNGQIALTSADFSSKGAQKKINLAQIIQEKLHNIEGIMPRAKAVKGDDLEIIKSSGMSHKEWSEKHGYLLGAENCGNGQINLATDVGVQSDGVNILHQIAHEMQHAADFITMYRGGNEATNQALENVGMTLENYYKENADAIINIDSSIEYMKKVIDKKGLAKRGTPEFDEAVKLYEMNFKTKNVNKHTSLEEHDSLDFEKRAIERSNQQIGVYSTVCNKITEFLVQFLR